MPAVSPSCRPPGSAARPLGKVSGRDYRRLVVNERLKDGLAPLPNGRDHLSKDFTRDRGWHSAGDGSGFQGDHEGARVLTHGRGLGGTHVIRSHHYAEDRAYLRTGALARVR
jgi:hypothetical protein